jgi:hypothetical protein
MAASVATFAARHNGRREGVAPHPAAGAAHGALRRERAERSTPGGRRGGEPKCPAISFPGSLARDLLGRRTMRFVSIAFAGLLAAGCMGSLDTWSDHWGTTGDGDDPGGDPSDGLTPTDRPGLPDDPPRDDSSDGPSGDDPDGDDPDGDDPDDPPHRPASGDVSAGGACACDGDCRATDGFAPVCIHGICGVRATDDACPSGSTSACPADHRCWAGTGEGLCYPDFVPGQCDGHRDSEGSCVTDGTLDCWAVCGEYCDIPGNPPGGDPDDPSDDDPPDDDPADPDPPDDDPPDDPVDPDPPDVCEYPGGPHRLGRGSTIAPMRWPSAVVGRTETGTADLEDLYCDDSINGVFIYAGTTWCTYCGELLRDIAADRDTWERNGVVWIFIVSDATSPALASGYIDRYGIDFGFRTNDADNSAGRMAIAESGLFSTIPWVGVVRTSDMVLTHDMAASSFEPADVAADLGR